MAKKVDGKPKKDQYLQKALEDYNQALKIGKSTRVKPKNRSK